MHIVYSQYLKICLTLNRHTRITKSKYQLLKKHIHKPVAKYAQGTTENCKEIH